MNISAQRGTTDTVVMPKQPITNAKRNLVPLLRTLFFLKSNIKNISYFCFQKNRSRNGTSLSDPLYPMEENTQLQEEIFEKGTQ